MSTAWPRSMPAILRDAGIAALVALGLGATMLGLRTEPVGRTLTLIPRPGLLLSAVAAVFVGRILVGLFMAQRELRRTIVSPAPRAVLVPPGFGSWLGKAAGPAMLAFAMLMPFMPGVGRYEVDLGTLVLTYVMLGWGLNIVVGLAGLLDLGYVAFYALGAYSFALLSTHFDAIGFWTALPLAGILAMFWGVILGFPVLRLRGDYLAIVTLAFGEIIRVVLLNWYDFTGGPNGISSIPRPSFFGLEFTRRPPEGGDSFASFFGLEFSAMHRLIFLYYLILVLALLTHVFVSRLRKLPVGRAWEALREDEIACKAMGMNTTNIKLSAFAIGAMFGGFAGAFFAARQGFISPESFTFTESAIILAIVVLGGMGSQMGVVLAATLLVLIPEFGRNFAEYRMLLFGMAMVLIMVWRPGGLLAHREPTLRLSADGKAARGGA